MSGKPVSKKNRAKESKQISTLLSVNLLEGKEKGKSLSVTGLYKGNFLSVLVPPSRLENVLGLVERYMKRDTPDSEKESLVKGIFLADNLSACPALISEGKLKLIKESLAKENSLGNRVLGISLNEDEGSCEFSLDNEALPEGLNEMAVKLLTNTSSENLEGTVRGVRNFLVKIYSNPDKALREDFPKWVKAQEKTGGSISLLETGDFIGYKSCAENTELGYIGSFHEGPGSVIFTEDKLALLEELIKKSPGSTLDKTSRLANFSLASLPNEPGFTVFMNRKNVVSDSSEYCAQGLHVGTYSYAKSFYGSTGKIMAVRFSPYDMVSVPHDGHEKLRVSMYEVIGEITKPLPGKIYSDKESLVRDLENSGCEAPVLYEGHYSESSLEKLEKTLSDKRRAITPVPSKAPKLQVKLVL